GIKIELAEQLLPVALTLSLIYLLISFLIYLTDDLINYTAGSFIQEHIKMSSSEQSQAVFENSLVGLLKRNLDIRDAESIAKELRRFLFVIGPDHEDFMSKRVANELKIYADKQIIANDVLDEIKQNVLADYRAIRREAEDRIKASSPLKVYRYFRIFR